MKTLLIRFIALLTLLLSSPSFAQGLGQSNLPEPFASSPLLQPVKAIRCLVVDRQSGFESIVNICGECRTAHIEHKRPRQSAINRTIPVPGKAKIQLSFRGPGTTRITSETYCGNQNPTLPTEQNRKCVSIRPFKTSGLTLVNICEQCRQVIVERKDAAGKTARTLNKVGGRSYAPLSRDGAETAQILDESPCRD